MLNEITEYKVQKVIITYKDRLTKLSYNVFEELFKKYGTESLVKGYLEGYINYLMDLLLILI